MAYNIVKHRRGTTKEWLECDLVPHSGELVIEECQDGIRRCKIGDGVSPFSKLPYIDDKVKNELLERLLALKSAITDELATVCKELRAEDTELKQYLNDHIDTITNTVIDSYKAGDAALLNRLSSDIAKAISGIDAEVSSVKEDFATQLSNKLSALAAEFSSLLQATVESFDAKLENRLGETATELAIDYQAKITAASRSLEALLTEVTARTNSAIDTLRVEASELVLGTESRCNENINTIKAELASADVELSKAISAVQQQNDVVTAELADKLSTLTEKTEQLDTNDSILLTRLYSTRNELLGSTTKLATELASLKLTHDNQYAELVSTIAQLEHTLTDTDIAITESLLDYVAKIYAELTDLVEDDILILTRVYSFNATLSNSIVELDNKLTAAIEELVEAFEQRQDSIEQIVEEKLEEFTIVLDETIDYLKNDLLDNIESLRSETNLAIGAIEQSVLESLQTVKETKEFLQSQLDSISGIIEANRALIETDLQTVNTRVDELAETITDTTEELALQTRRIDGLLALPDGATAHDAELLDIRVGYNGIDHESAGNAVRAIGADLDALKASLPSYIPDNAVDGLLYENNQLYLTSKGDTVGDPVEITGGGGLGSVSTVKITNNLSSNVFTVAKGNEAWIDFTYTSYENGVATGDGTYAIFINDKKVDELSGSVQHGVAKPIELSSYLKNDSNTVKVTCTDQYGSYKNYYYTITVIELRIESTFDSTRIFNDTITFRYKVYGKIEKTVHILVDGSEVYTKQLSASVSGNDSTYVFPVQPHGCHKIQAYVTASLNDDTIPSNKLEYDVVCIVPDNNEAIIASVYTTKTATQGDLVTIPYIVYDPVRSSSDIELIVYAKVAGELIEYDRVEASVGREQQFWKTRKYPSGEAVFVISYTYDLYGEQKTITKQHTITVSTLKVDISAEEDSLQLYLSAQGRSNTEKNPAIWTFTQEPAGGKIFDTITTDFSGFNWRSNGWITDNAGDTCLRLTGDAKIIINFKPFEKDFKRSGKTIEFEFSVRDVNSRDTVVIDCFDGSCGFRATPDTAFLQSSGTKVSCRYKDEERVRVTVAVEYEDSASRFVSIYLDGVLSGVQRYSTSDIFQQSPPLNITIGSNLCGIDVYSVRIYDKALSTEQALNNFIADKAEPSTKLQLLTDNSITFTRDDAPDLDFVGRISYEKVKALGQIPIITFTGPMPTYKGDKKKKTTRMKFEDPANPELNFDVLLDQIDVQGTSSQFYVRKNWKVKLPEALPHMPGAIPAKVFCIKVDYAEATGTHNTGTANYVETFYDREEVTLPPQKDDPRVRTTIQGFPCIIFEKETEDSEPVFSSKGNFNYDKDAENAFGFTEAYDSYGVECWEFCNNTSNAVNFASKIPTAWEDDFEPRYVPASAKFSRIEDLLELKENAKSGKGNFTEAQQTELTTLQTKCIANFKEMHDWVLSTATYRLVEGKKVPIEVKPLPAPVTYGTEPYTKTYTEDNEEYRLAKFENEFTQYFNMHYTCIYYVFTFFALMVDQRAKNLFLTRWKDDDGVYRWYPYFYDNDTIFGINNEGALVFDYYHEDTDQLGSANVYNGQNSVFWNNFRECFPLQIQDTYAKLRSDKKLTYDAIINQYISLGSDKWSAAIYNEDAEYKYVSMARQEHSHKDAEGNEVYGVDASNLYQVRGPGEHHLRYFIDNRINYCDSKWYAGNYPSDDIFLRVYTPKPEENATQEEIDRINASLAAVPADPKITITPYSDMYAGVRYKSGTLQQARLEAGKPYTFAPIEPLDELDRPESAEDTGDSEAFGDTETAIYGAGEISSLGDLSGLYCGVINLSKASKLKELIIGNANPAYYNDNFREISVGSNRLLRSIDLRNCFGLGINPEASPQKTLDLSLCPNIEHIYTEGTNLELVELPESGYIKTLHLPISTRTLVIKNQQYISDFVLDSYANVKTMRIENCPTLNTSDMLEACKKPDGSYSVERVRLTGLNWKLDNADFIKTLYPKFDADGKLISGIRGLGSRNEPLDDAYLEGTCHIKKLTGSEYAEIREHYKQDALVIKFDEMTSNITFKYSDANGNEYEQLLELKCYDSKLGEISHLPELIAPPAWPENDAFTYEQIGWSYVQQPYLGLEDYEDNYKAYVRADALINIAGDRVLYPVFKAIRKTYEVRFINSTANNSILYSYMVPYGSFAVVPDNLVVEKGDTSAPECYEHVGWYPDPAETPVIEAISYYAQFAFIDDKWYEITLGDIADGYTTDPATYKMRIFECNNNLPQNPAIVVPESFKIGSDTFSVVSLGGFYNHNNLELIRLPNTLTELSFKSYGAFQKCINLLETTLPESLEIIGSQAFMECAKLKEINIPSAVTSIGTAAFAYCTDLQRILVSENSNVFKLINDCLIDTRSKKLVQGLSTSIIPQNKPQEDPTIKELGAYCFAGTRIQIAQIPDNITSVTRYAFDSCKALNKVLLPKGVKTLEFACFSGCSKLSEIVLPDSIETINGYAFNDCLLESLEVPASVNSIGNRSFGSLRRLKTVVFKERKDEAGSVVIPNIDAAAFTGTSNTDGEQIVFTVPWKEADTPKAPWGASNCKIIFADKEVEYV